MSSEKDRYLGRADQIQDSGIGLVFDLSADGFERGFAIRYRGRVRAYRNTCPHAGSQLDWTEGDFFDDSGRYLICATHGALFEPLTGQCVRGPCIGRTLEPLRVSVSDGEIWLQPHN